MRQTVVRLGNTVKEFRSATVRQCLSDSSLRYPRAVTHCSMIGYKIMARFCKASSLSL